MRATKPINTVMVVLFVVFGLGQSMLKRIVFYVMFFLSFDLFGQEIPDLKEDWARGSPAPPEHLTGGVVDVSGSVPLSSTPSGDASILSLRIKNANLLKVVRQQEEMIELLKIRIKELESAK